MASAFYEAMGQHVSMAQSPHEAHELKYRVYEQEELAFYRGCWKSQNHKPVLRATPFKYLGDSSYLRHRKHLRPQVARPRIKRYHYGVVDEYSIS